MVLRDLGLEYSNTRRNSCCQASEVGRTFVAGGCETSERRGYHVVQVSHDARELLVSGPSRLACRISGTRDEESHATNDLGELKTRYLRGQPVGAIVFEPQTSLGVFGGVLRCRPCWRVGNTHVPFWSGSHVGEEGGHT